MLHHFLLSLPPSPSHFTPSFLPIPHMPQNNPRRRLRTMLPPNRLHKIALGIHQIKINTMIHKIILSLLHPLRRRKVHSILLTYILDLFPSACEAYDRRVEFGEVGGEHAGCVAGWVAGDEEGEDGREGGWGGVYEVDHLGHFVEFFGADVGAVGEAKINLSQDSHQHIAPSTLILPSSPSCEYKVMGKTYQGIPSLHIRICKHLPILIQQAKRSPDLRFPNAFRSFRNALPFHPRFLISEIKDQPCAGGEEEEACFPGEGL